MEIHIRNMVCDRCIRSVRSVFEKSGLSLLSIRLGVVETNGRIPASKISEVKKQLEAEGFEWLDDQRVKLAEQIKHLIIDLVQNQDLDDWKLNLSQYLSRKLNKDYHQLTLLFSSLENTTIEQFFILQKIEKVKEWLVYNEMTLSEMAFKLGYSSVAHLSGQFKKVTGFTPTAFRQLKDHHRKAIDKV